VGFYNQKAIDHYTGAPIAVKVDSASEAEWNIYEDLFITATNNLGEMPRAIVGDRGFSIPKVFKRNTEQGVASVFPYRKVGTRKRPDEDNEIHDRHGIPRCKHCGGPTRFVRFSKANPKPRLWYRCTLGTTGGCKKDQTVYCERNWKMLLPLWRTDDVYMALRNAHQRYERVHHHWRTRYRVGADDNALRPKRRGAACQQLRANAALVVEWLRIMARQGWLGSARRRDCEHTIAPAGRAYNLATTRRVLQLDQPYGQAAVTLGLGPERPPAPLPQPDTG